MKFQTQHRSHIPQSSCYLGPWSATHLTCPLEDTSLRMETASPGDNLQDILSTWQKVAKTVRQGVRGHRDIACQSLGFQVVEEKLVAVLISRGIAPRGFQPGWAPSAMQLQSTDHCRGCAKGQEKHQSLYKGLTVLGVLSFGFSEPPTSPLETAVTSSPNPKYDHTPSACRLHTSSGSEGNCGILPTGS